MCKWVRNGGVMKDSRIPKRLQNAKVYNTEEQGGQK